MKRNPYMEAVITTALAAGVMLVMMRPDLRQTLIMRASHYARVFCQARADFWQKAATTAANTYNRARI